MLLLLFDIDDEMEKFEIVFQNIKKIVDGEKPNQIQVPPLIQEGSLWALERMLSIKK